MHFIIVAKKNPLFTSHPPPPPIFKPYIKNTAWVVALLCVWLVSQIQLSKA